MKVFLHFLRRTGFSGEQQKIYARVGMAVDAWLHDKGYLRPIPTVSGIAADIGVEPDRLAEYLRRKTGKTVLGWRKGLRIEEAKRLLLDRPDLSIAAVAELVGIGDKSNFKRQFAEMVRMSPGDWRKSHGR